jgi:hypothetical protein
MIDFLIRRGKDMSLVSNKGTKMLGKAVRRQLSECKGENWIPPKSMIPAGTSILDF